MSKPLSTQADVPDLGTQSAGYPLPPSTNGRKPQVVSDDKIPSSHQGSNRVESEMFVQGSSHDGDEQGAPNARNDEDAIVSPCRCGHASKTKPRFKITLWRMVNTAFVLAFVTWKYVSAKSGEPTANDLDLAVGLGWALIAYWFGIIESECPTFAPWFFQDFPGEFLMVASLAVFAILYILAILSIGFKLVGLAFTYGERYDLRPVAGTAALLGALLATFVLIFILSWCIVVMFMRFDRISLLSHALWSSSHPFSYDDWNMAVAVGRLFERQNGVEMFCIILVSALIVGVSITYIVHVEGFEYPSETRPMAVQFVKILVIAGIILFGSLFWSHTLEMVEERKAGRDYNVEHRDPGSIVEDRGNPFCGASSPFALAGGIAFLHGTRRIQFAGNSHTLYSPSRFFFSTVPDITHPLRRLVDPAHLIVPSDSFDPLTLVNANPSTHPSETPKPNATSAPAQTLSAYRTAEGARPLPKSHSRKPGPDQSERLKEMNIHSRLITQGFQANERRGD
ncbi:hypothetical protein NMY22_g700 [Coprinellus aureogranulatus]|nr:hypothetical protein NMY22_g700 [Coprinellus aureogranulatus]